MRKARTNDPPRPPLIRCSSSRDYEYLRNNYGCRNENWYKFPYDQRSAHTLPARKLECRARARAADRVVLGFSRTLPTTKNEKWKCEQSRRRRHFLGSSSFRADFFFFPHNREYLHNINFYVPSRYLPEYASFLRLDTVRASLCEWSALFPPSSQRQRR